MPPIAPNHIAQLMQVADGGTNAIKGQTLERVVRDTFCLIEGVGHLFSNVVDEDGAAEFDILLYNQRHPTGLPFLPDNILIECKNWAAPVGTAVIRAFTSKLNECRLDFGILVASNGITGDQTDLTSGRAHLRREFDRVGLRVVVIDRLELEGLASTEDLGELLRKKFGAFIMGVTRL